MVIKNDLYDFCITKRFWIQSIKNKAFLLWLYQPSRLSPLSQTLARWPES